MSTLEKWLIFVSSLLYLLTAIYSYSHVDLNLTLSQNPLTLDLVGKMQALGYYNRPLSTLIYLLLIVSNFLIFGIILLLFKRNKLGKKFLVSTVAANFFILILAYPFLSSDLFNYMFDAKILYKYHLNPYAYKALDFPNDEWIRFMRWVHRYSPYGPLWIGMSIIPTILGFGKFISTLFTFKIFIGLFHLLNAFLIYKTLKIINPKIALLGTALYAANPILLIEGLVNSHNDVILATCFISSIYFYAKHKKIFSLTTLIFGMLGKYISVLVLPVLVYFNWIDRKQNIKTLIYINFAIMGIFTMTYSTIKISTPFVSSGATQVQFQPWYLFWILPFLALVPTFWTILFTFVISFFALLRYVPYLYFGDWSHQGTTEFMKNAILAPIIITGLVIILRLQQFYFKKNNHINSANKSK